jgi:hypothetical protein
MEAAPNPGRHRAVGERSGPLSGGRSSAVIRIGFQQGDGSYVTRLGPLVLGQASASGDTAVMYW